MGGFNQKQRLERYHWTGRHYQTKEHIESSPAKLQLPQQLQFWRYSYFLDLLRRIIGVTRPSVGEIVGGEEEAAITQDLPDFVRDNYPDVTAEDVARVLYWLKKLDYDNWRTEQELKQLPSGVDQEKLLPYLNNIIFMKAIATQKDIAFVAVLQPMLLPPWIKM